MNLIWGRVESIEQTRAHLVVADDPLDFHAVYDANASYVAGVAYRILGGAADIDDVTHDVFLRVLKQLHQLEDRQALRAWLIRLTIGECSRRLRRQKILAWVGLSHDVVAPDCSPEDHARLSEVYTALEQVPIDERIAWTLRHIEGERLDAVALACGCSLATAKRRIARAEILLSEKLGDPS